MKILVREIKDNACNYVWKKVRSVNPFSNGNYCTEDGMSYNITQILKITHDYRKSGYVQCANCGKVFKRSKTNKHYEDRERNANCMKCDWLHLDEISGTSVHTLRSDGKVITKTVSTPKCTKGNYRRNWELLSEVNKVAECQFYACRRSRTRGLMSDFMSENPNPFNELLTEKSMKTNEWRCFYNSPSGRQYSNKNGKIIARFDANGILVEFSIIHRNNTFSVVYSDVYDKLIDRYGEFNWGYYNIANSTKEKCMKQIRQLYK